MKKIFVWAAILICASSAVAIAGDEVKDLFLRSNEAYKNRNYAQALLGYEQLASKVSRPEVHYDLANAAFKENQLGKAILHYLKAKKLDPRDADIRKNLKYAQSLIEYRVEDKRNWYVQQFMKLLDYIRLRECFVILLVIYLLLVGIFISGLIFGSRASLGRLSSYLIVILIISSIPTLIKFSQSRLHREAVVTSPKVEVRYGPSKDEKLAFNLVEGIQVSIDDEIEDWYRISLVNGETGWALKNGIENV